RALRRARPDPAASARRGARLRARAVAGRRPRCGAPRPRAGRPPAGRAAGGSVKRTGPGVLVLSAALGGAAGFLVDQLLTAAGRPTYAPTVSLPILLV